MPRSAGAAECWALGVLGTRSAGIAYPLQPAIKSAYTQPEYGTLAGYRMPPGTHPGLGGTKGHQPTPRSQPAPRRRPSVGYGKWPRRRPAAVLGHARELGVLDATFTDFDGNWMVRTAATRRRRRDKEKGEEERDLGCSCFNLAYGPYMSRTPRGLYTYQVSFVLPTDPKNELSGSETPLDSTPTPTMTPLAHLPWEP